MLAKVCHAEVCQCAEGKEHINIPVDKNHSWENSYTQKRPMHLFYAFTLMHVRTQNIHSCITENFCFEDIQDYFDSCMWYISTYAHVKKIIIITTLPMKLSAVLFSVIMLRGWVILDCIYLSIHNYRDRWVISFLHSRSLPKTKVNFQ